MKIDKCSWNTHATLVEICISAATPKIVRGLENQKQSATIEQLHIQPTRQNPKRSLCRIHIGLIAPAAFVRLSRPHFSRCRTMRI